MLTEEGLLSLFLFFLFDLFRLLLYMLSIEEDNLTLLKLVIDFLMLWIIPPIKVK